MNVNEIYESYVKHSRDCEICSFPGGTHLCAAGREILDVLLTIFALLRLGNG